MGTVHDIRAGCRSVALLDQAADELAKADVIIAALLQHLMIAEKDDCARKLAAQGVIDAGMTRANEREVVLHALGVDTTKPAHRRTFK